MRIKKLDIFGFKSFASRQKIFFQDGITAVVGPNGCGKSNVVDALRWVMGEQNARHLRGSNMQDIIFCGSEKKAPLGFAEVTLTIDNQDHSAPLEYNHFDEIEITRRLYKTGDSEFEINRQKVRLKDITEFFLGTGVGTKAYSIIEQGRVNEVISAKPQDRRIIIEEAAGITKYKSKKAAAERRMDATRQNLERIIDIKNEVERRVSSLEKEKEKLERVSSFREKIKNLELHCASHEYLFFLAQKRFFQEKTKKTTTELEEHRREFASLEQSFEKSLHTYSSKNEQQRTLENLLTQHSNSRELQIKDQQFANSTLNENRILVQKLTQQIQETKERSSEIAKDIQVFEEEYQKFKREHQETCDQLRVVQDAFNEVHQKRQKGLFDERHLQNQITGCASKAARMQAQIQNIEERQIQRKNDAATIDCDIEERVTELTQSKTKCQQLEHDLDQGKSSIQELQTQIDYANEEKQELISRINLEKESLKNLETNLINRQSRLASLEEISQHLEWSESGLKTILESEHKNLIKALVADIVEVKPGFEELVEKCLSHLLDTGLVQEKDHIKKLANYLREQTSPTTSLLFLNEQQDLTSSKENFGLKCLDELVTVAEGFSQYLTPQLSCYLIAETIDDALEVWTQAAQKELFILSKSGELFLPNNKIVVLGEKSNKGVLQRKNQVAELTRECGELKNELDQKIQSLEVLSNELDIREQNWSQLKDEKQNLVLGTTRLEESLKQSISQKEQFIRELNLAQERKLKLEKQGTDDQEKLQELKDEWATSLEQHKSFEGELNLLSEARTEVEKDYDIFQNRVKDLEVKKAASFEKSQSMKNAHSQAKSNFEHLEKQIENFSNQIEEKSQDELILTEQERQCRKKIEELEKEIENTSKLLEETKVEVVNLKSKKDSLEQKLAEINQVISTKNNFLHEFELKINNIANEIKFLKEKIFERYRLDLSLELSKFHCLSLDEAFAKDEIGKLKKALERIGSVNENAGKEYQEFKERLDFLLAQIDDLNDALLQLESAIEKINKTTQMRFLESFNNINKQFSLVFPRLFNGGSAMLKLSDEEDLLNSGVEIYAKPPGKAIGTVELMSGGEKALTAISLIMAIFLIKPSPFCLLDEVDAPLDEANVSRFSQMVKEMSSLSQFIVITHNRKTMESADALYGVTMEEAGSSKIVAVQVQEAFDALKQTKKLLKAPKPSQLSLDSFN